MHFIKNKSQIQAFVLNTTVTNFLCSDMSDFLRAWTHSGVDHIGLHSVEIIVAYGHVLHTGSLYSRQCLKKKPRTGDLLWVNMSPTCFQTRESTIRNKSNSRAKFQLPVSGKIILKIIICFRYGGRLYRYRWCTLTWHTFIFRLPFLTGVILLLHISQIWKFHQTRS